MRAARAQLRPARRDPFARKKEPRGRGALLSAAFPPCPAPTAQHARTVGVGRTQGYRAQGIRVWGALLGCSFLLTDPPVRDPPGWDGARGGETKGPRWFMGLGAAAKAKVRAAGMWRARGGGGPDRSLAHLGGWSSVWTSRAGGRPTAGCLSLEWERERARSVGLGVLCGAANSWGF